MEYESQAVNKSNAETGPHTYEFKQLPNYLGYCYIHMPKESLLH